MVVGIIVNVDLLSVFFLNRNQLPLCQDLQRIIEPSQKLTTVQDKMAMAVAAQPYVVAMLVPAAMMMPSNAQVGSEIGQEVKRSGFLKLRNLRMAFELELFENLILHRFSLLRRVKRQREFCRFLEVPSGTPSNSDGYTPHWGQDNCERFFPGSFHSLCFIFGIKQSSVWDISEGFPENNSAFVWVVFCLI